MTGRGRRPRSEARPPWVHDDATERGAAAMTVLTLGTELEIAAPVEAPLASRVQVEVAARPRLATVLRRVGLPSAVSRPIDIVDQWGEQSFPASDPPSNW